MYTKSLFERNGIMCDVVRRERQKLGLTQEQLAEKIGVQKNTISLIERDKTGMRESTANALMHLFECNELYLTGVSPYKTREEEKLARYSDFRQEEVKRYKAVQDVISIGTGWERIGTIGMLYKLADGDRKKILDGTPYCFVAGSKEKLPDDRLFDAQYYVFKSPEGERVISCIEYDKFLPRVLGFVRMELSFLADHLPAAPGWEGYYEVLGGEISIASLLSFFKKEKEEKQ